MNEAETRAELIAPKLKESGWGADCVGAGSTGAGAVVAASGIDTGV